MTMEMTAQQRKFYKKGFDYFVTLKHKELGKRLDLCREQLDNLRAQCTVEQLKFGDLPAYIKQPFMELKLTELALIDARMKLTEPKK